VSTIYEAVSGEGRSVEEKMSKKLFAHAFDRIAGDLEVPSTSIYSKLDGVVNWRACLVRENERSENVEVLGASHVGLGVNAAVLWAVADRLAQAPDQFERFKRGGPFGLAYGRS
jgi:hypothetical protein